MKKKKILKILGIGAIVVILLVAIGAAVLLTNLNSIARKAIVDVAEFVLQVDVELEAVDIKATSGEVKLTRLVIGNPEGYKTEHAFAVDEMHVKADIKSFTSGEPNIHLISITQPHVTLEQGFRGSNLKTLSDNAARFSKDKPVSEDEAEAEAEMNIVIDKILVEKTKVSISAPALQGQKATVTLPKIEMNDFGKDKDNLTIAEAISLFFNKLLAESVKAGRDVLTEDLANALKSGTGSLSDAAGMAGESARKAADTVGGTVKDAAGGITGIIGRKKTEEETKEEEK